MRDLLRPGVASRGEHPQGEDGKQQTNGPDHKG
jgi:hypothetical protein